MCVVCKLFFDVNNDDVFVVIEVDILMEWWDLVVMRVIVVDGDDASEWRI